MLVELGHFALILAMMVAAAQALLGLLGAQRGLERAQTAAHAAVRVQAALVAVAMAALLDAFIGNDFSVAYVAQNSNSQLPIFYRIAALWGAHEGSLLLWIAILAAWSLAFAWCTRHMDTAFVARTLGVLGLLSFGFMLFTLATSSPFERLFPAAIDGRDLNPLLQDFALAIHPPILYGGYVGFSVPFAMACATLLEGRRDQQWAHWMRSWTVLPWAFLAVGIALGSWWAYYELGWGGYWFWDPVENASFMPWLLGTALIHSLAVTDKRGLFKSWTLLLAIGTFSLTLLGTFLVRSGVLVSVHSFAADPARGVFILLFLVLVIGGALVLYAWRAPQLGSTTGFALLSRESVLLFNNLLLVVATAVVFGGTLGPLISELAGLGTLSVGPPYFNPSFMLPMLPMLALLGLGIHVRWKRSDLSGTQRRLWIAAALALLLTALVAGAAYHSTRVMTWIGCALAFWIAASSLIDPIDRIRRRMRLSAAVLGMTVAHLGVATCVLGLSLVETASIERDFALKPGETAQVGAYTFRYLGGENIQGPNYQGFRGVVQVEQGDRLVSELQPEKRLYTVQQSVMTEAGIDAGWNRDLFAALGEEVGEGGWSLRLQYRPLIRFIWLGALLMAIGGALSALDRRISARHASVTAGIGG